METSEVLNLAADLIETRGWAGLDVPTMFAWGEHDNTSPVCLEGAIFAASGFVRGHDERECPGYVAMQQHLDMSASDHLWDFNDQIGRTQSEVIEALRAAALIESARESQVAAEATYAENLAVTS